MKVPEEIYFVERMPPEDESKPYYGRRLSRLYRRYSDVEQFLQTGKNASKSGFRVFKANITGWEEL